MSKAHETGHVGRFMISRRNCDLSHVAGRLHNKCSFFTRRNDFVE